METFNVICYDFNKNKFESYDVIPYFVNAYKELVENHRKHPENDYFKIPKTFEEFKHWLKRESQNQFWGRCEYEFILLDWPNQKHSEKWDIHGQIGMNLSIITKYVMDSI